MSIEKWIDVLMECEEEFNLKEKRRKTRKSNRLGKVKKDLYTVNRAIGPNASKFLKKAKHKENRRSKGLCYNSNKGENTLKLRLWNIS